MSSDLVLCSWEPDLHLTHSVQEICPVRASLADWSPRVRVIEKGRERLIRPSSWMSMGAVLGVLGLEPWSLLTSKNSAHGRRQTPHVWHR